jgi:hypothetical protein
MALNDIKFIRGNGGLGRPLPGEDHISGLLYYTAAGLPVGYGSDNTKQILDVSDAEAKGITGNPGDAFAALHYHVAEFFRINPGAMLFVGIYPQGATYAEIELMQNFAEGKIRQFGVYTQNPLVVSGGVPAVALLEAQAKNLEAKFAYADILLCADISSIADLTTLPDLRTLRKPDVSVCIAQAGNADGKNLFAGYIDENGTPVPSATNGKTVGCIGAVLGTLSAAKVNECIGWVEKFDVAGTQLDVPAMGNGQLVKNVESVLDTLSSRGYIFLRKHIGISGSYWNDSHNCDAATSDYAFIEANRTMKKAMRGIRTYLLPFLNGNISVDEESGKLSAMDVATLENAAQRALDEMKKAKELSGYRAYINPDQDVLATSNVEIDITNVPTGVIRKMNVKIGYAKTV